MAQESGMTPEELRLECLKLVLQSANASGLTLDASQLISRARTYADFVMNWRGPGGAENVNGVQSLERNSDEGLRRHRPPASQFETGTEGGRPLGVG
jgi:hypothetical protein